MCRAMTALVVCLSGFGCAAIERCAPCGDAKDKACQYDPDSKTLFEWALCKPAKDEKGGNGGKDELVRTAAVAPEDGEQNSDGEKDRKNGGKDGAKEEDTIKTDRPDFTEASSTVGKGRIQIESGYTFFTDRANGIRTDAHSYPEVLLRVGMFADWFELRVGQNVGTVRTRNALAGQVMPATPELNGRDSGLEDLYLGTKIALTEQKGFLPELATIIQTTVPTGADAFTANKVLPGLSLLYSWELTPKWSLAGSVLVNKSVTEEGRSYYEFANSLSIGRSLTEKLGSYFEYFAFYPSGASHSDVRPQYFLNGGFTYLITNNMQFDIRAGVGLNRAATDFFAGSGLSLRF